MRYISQKIYFAEIYILSSNFVGNICFAILGHFSLSVRSTLMIDIYFVSTINNGKNEVFEMLIMSTIKSTINELQKLQSSDWIRITEPRNEILRRDPASRNESCGARPWSPIWIGSVIRFVVPSRRRRLTITTMAKRLEGVFVRRAT